MAARRVLRQPGGFEGLLAARKPLVAEDPSPTECVHAPVVEHVRDTACLALYGSPGSGGKLLVACVDGGTVALTVPGISELAE
jgi:hypothetical protein